MFIDRLKRVLDRPDLDADTVMLALDVRDLAGMLFRTIRLAIFQQMQATRLAELVSVEHVGEAHMIITRGNEVGEAVSAEFEAWLGPGAVEWLAELEAKQAEIRRPV